MVDQEEKKKVQVWIHAAQSVLMLRLISDRGGYWQPVTGWLDPGESLEAAAKREAFEETGLQFTGEPRSLKYDFRYVGKWGNAHEFGYELEAALAPNGDLPKVTIDPKEHVEYEWMPLKKAMSLLKHPAHQQCLSLLAKLTN